MLKSLFAVFDRVSEQFSFPIEAPSSKALARSLLDNQFYREHVEDFAIVWIATFDDRTGITEKVNFEGNYLELSSFLKKEVEDVPQKI